MTNQPADPTASANSPANAPARRRRNTAPLDPRRSPEGLAVGEPAPLTFAGQQGDDGDAVTGIAGIAGGVAVLRAALRNVPASPGVYRMLNRKGDALYVGKARNLKSRVQNYTHPAGLSNRIRRMVAETATFEIVETTTEAEALLLECNLIKRLMPRYNVLLRDDKSFPFIHLTAGRDFPQLEQVSRSARQAGVVFRAVRVGRRGQSHPGCAAEGIPAALLQRQHLQQPHPALPAASDQAVQRAVRRADRPAPIMQS